MEEAESNSISIDDTNNDNSNIISTPTDSGKRIRLQNCTWEDSVEMVRLVEKHGKNWDKILTILHQEHHATYIQDKEQVSRCFSTITDPSSMIWKEYKAPKFTKKKAWTKEETI